MTTPLAHVSVGELPEYWELLHQRRKLVLPLLILTVAVYFTFILAIAFAPQLLAEHSADSVISRGIWSGLGVILFIFAITGIYVHKANRKLEPLILALQQKAEGR